MDKIASLNALLATLDTRNRISNLPGTDAIKRELNHQLARGSAIAAVYIDIVGFEAYCKARAGESQRQIIEFFSKLLVGLTRSLGIYEYFLAHMGRQHFVLMLKLEDHEKYCNHLLQTFDDEVKKFYTPQEIGQGYIIAPDAQGRDAKAPLRALAVGVAHTQYRQFKSAKKMFEVLAQVRQKAQPTEGRSVMFVDRRRADR
jgi:GGDEF domain-containing protein